MGLASTCPSMTICLSFNNSLLFFSLCGECSFCYKLREIYLESHLLIAQSQGQSRDLQLILESELRAVYLIYWYVDKFSSHHSTTTKPGVEHHHWMRALLSFLVPRLMTTDKWTPRHPENIKFPNSSYHIIQTLVIIRSQYNATCADF